MALTIVDDASPLISYQGLWHTPQNPGGAIPDTPYDGTWHDSNNPNNFTIPFTGQSFAIIAITTYYAVCPNVIQFSIDGGAPRAFRFSNCPPSNSAPPDYVYNQSATSGPDPIPPAADGTNNHKLFVQPTAASLVFDYAIFGTVNEVNDFLNTTAGASTSLTFEYATGSTWPAQPTTSTSASSAALTTDSLTPSPTDSTSSTTDSTSPNSGQASSGSSHGSSAGPAAGGAVGGIIVIALIILGILFYRRRSAARWRDLNDGANGPRIDAYEIGPFDGAAQTSGMMKETMTPTPSNEPLIAPTFPSSNSSDDAARPLSYTNAIEHAHPSPALMARRAATLQELTRANVAPELIVQILENMREDEGYSMAGSSTGISDFMELPRDAASPAPPPRYEAASQPQPPVPQAQTQTTSPPHGKVRRAR